MRSIEMMITMMRRASKKQPICAAGVKVKAKVKVEPLL